MIIDLNLLITVAALIFAVVLTVSWFNTAKAVREINGKMDKTRKKAVWLKEQGNAYEFAGNTDKALEFYKLAIYQEAYDMMIEDMVKAKDTEAVLKENYLWLVQRCGGEWPDFSIIN